MSYRNSMSGLIITTVFLLLFTLCLPVVSAQTGGTVRGRILLESNQSPMHDVAVTIVRLSLTTTTNENGEYEFTNVPAGTWSMLTHLDGFPDAVQTITINAGETLTADFAIKIGGLRDQITVSASGREQSAFETFQSVTSLDNITLTEKAQPSLGDVLDKQPGVAKRSFGPGSTRPIVRGFDGDRVLVLQDGMQTGSVGSQSGDHGEPIDVLSLERLEVVKGPAALLYGSNAIGGVVNAITSHGTEARPHQGWRGYLTGVGATNVGQASGSAGVEYGTEKFLLWVSGSGQRQGDYQAPVIGAVDNSKVYSRSANGGAGYYGTRGYLSGGYGFDMRRFGVPFAGLLEGEPDAQTDLSMRRHNLTLNTGFEAADGFISRARLSLNYSGYQHRELEIDNGTESVGTIFNNDVLTFRGLFEQQRRGVWTGSFGFQGTFRDYESIGAESLAPPTTQRAMAVFGLQEFDFQRIGFQLGGRLEHNRYLPDTGNQRQFTGFSGAAGTRIPLWEDGLFVANYSYTFRAPALEELYNNGPHPGNLTFEIGNSGLTRERGNGLDLSLRHNQQQMRAEVNFFYYALSNFVFLAPTGEREDGLPVATYSQADARYRGMEASLDVRLLPTLWLNSGLDYVDAELKNSGLGLPRIPPLRGRIGFDWRWHDFSLRPEVALARDQNKVFTNETRTPGYAVFGLGASYTLASQHVAQIFSLNAFNLNNRLYRNHTSFIKDLAPEIGRGVRFSYTMRFF